MDVLADVRTTPRVKYSVQYNQEDLRESVTNAGLRYAFFGDTLGGRPGSDDMYDAAGHALYDRMAQSESFRAGLDKLMRGVRRGARVALMCSEEDPCVCHRCLLVGRVLIGQGVQMRHIRGDGTIQTEEELWAKPAPAAPLQNALFDDETLETITPQEERPWRSLKPIRPPKP